MRGSKTKDSSPADTVSLRKQVSLIQEAPASIGGGSSHYKNEIGDSPAHPDYITFNKMATCFDILDDAELAIQLHEEALRGVYSEIGGDIAANANGAALRLIMLANFLRTAEKNNFTDKVAALRQELQKSLDEYLNQVTLDSMKAPFADRQELLGDVEKMCRAILL